MNDPDAGQLGIPDGIEPLVGWRYWRADEGWLCSLNKFKTWPAGRPLRAQCTLAMDHGPLPGEQCGCGIYAAIDLPTLKELVQPDLESPLVVGEVSLWGKVMVKSYTDFVRRLAHCHTTSFLKSCMTPPSVHN